MSRIWAETEMHAAAEAAVADGDEDDVLPAELPPVGMAGEIETSFAPTVNDDAGDLLHRTILYPDWKPEDTVVISGPLPHGKKIKGRWFKSVEAAAKWVVETHGGYLERIRGAEKGGRWAFRIRKPEAK